MTKIATLDEIAQIVKQLQNRRILRVDFGSSIVDKVATTFNYNPVSFATNGVKRPIRKRSEGCLNAFGRKPRKVKLPFKILFQKTNFLIPKHGFHCFKHNTWG